jgi:hypothetical protein
MPLIIVLDNLCPTLYLLETNNMPSLFLINEDIVPIVLEDPKIEAVISRKRAYKKKKTLLSIQIIFLTRGVSNKRLR